MEPTVPARDSASESAEVPILLLGDPYHDLSYSDHVQAVLNRLAPLQRGNELAVVQAVIEMVSRTRAGRND